MMAGLVLVGALVFAAVLVAVKSGFLARVAAVTAPLQLWIAGGVASGSTLFGIFLLPLALLRLRRTHLTGLVLLVGAFTAWNAIRAVLAPDGIQIFRLTEVACVFGTVLLVTQATLDDPRVLRSCLRLAGPGVVLQSILTIVFRFRVDLEASYWSSAPARLLTGPPAALIHTVAGNNVLDETKSGGLLLNGNVASALLGFGFCVFLAAAVHYRSKGFLVVGLIAWVGALATGSKTGIGLAILMPLVVVLSVIGLQRGRALVRRVGVLVVAIGAAVVAIGAALGTADDYVGQSGDSYDLRTRLWALSWNVIGRHPLVGSGWTAFRDETAVHGRENLIPVGLPPHNFLLAAWMNTGIVGVCAQVAIVLFLLVQLLVCVARSDGRPAVTAAFLFGGVLWLLIHGMGDNTTFYGGFTTLPLFALVGVLARQLSLCASADTIRAGDARAGVASQPHRVAPLPDQVSA